MAWTTQTQRRALRGFGNPEAAGSTRHRCSTSAAVRNWFGSSYLGKAAAGNAIHSDAYFQHASARDLGG